MRHHPLRTTVLALVGVLLLAAPSLALSPRSTDDKTDPSILDGSAQRELDAARERWRDYGARAYRLRVRVTCFCPRQITRPRAVTVRGGKPVVFVPEHLRPFATVPRLFARVEEAIDGRVALLRATYDAHGVPRDVYVDRSFSIADEERGVTVDRFARSR